VNRNSVSVLFIRLFGGATLLLTVNVSSSAAETTSFDGVFCSRIGTNAELLARAYFVDEIPVSDSIERLQGRLDVLRGETRRQRSWPEVRDLQALAEVAFPSALPEFIQREWNRQIVADLEGAQIPDDFAGRLWEAQQFNQRWSEICLERRRQAE